MKFLLLALVFSSLVHATGENGREIIINNIDQAQSFNLSGKDGSDGSRGENGYSYYSPNCGDSVHYGGDGAQGSGGEDGGRGGNAIIHFSELSELSKLTIVSRGGRGGIGGEGGKGGSGCGGRDGSNGQRGYDGSDGKPGSLYLINQPKVYEKQNSVVQATFDKLIENKTILIENIWDKHKGANKLLAVGSVVADEYYIHNRTFKKKVIVNWLAPQDIAAFAKIPFTLQVVNEKLNLDYRGVIADQEITETNSEILITIRGMYKDSELISFNTFKPQGMGKDIKFEFTDAGVKTPELKMTYLVSATRERLIGSSESLLYKKPAADFVTIDGKKITLHVGQLDLPVKYLNKGTKLIITLDITYKIGEQVKTKQIDLAYKVGYINSKFQLDNSSF